MVSRLEIIHGRTRRNINRQATTAMARAWVLSDGINEDRFVTEAIAIAETARAAVVAEQDAYLALALSAQGANASPQGLDPSAYRRPIGDGDQWSRPFTQMRTKLDKGMELPQAVRFAGQQAQSMIATDLQMASRGAARDWMSNDTRVAAYARVLGSGGVSGENCGLCVVASTQRYWVGDLMPIHDHCTCEVKPLLDGQAGTQVIQENNLDEVHDRLAEMDGNYSNRNDLGRVRIKAGELPRPAVAPHAEVGPYLYNAKHAPPVLRAAPGVARPGSVRAGVAERASEAAIRDRSTGVRQPGWDLINRRT